MSVKMRIHITKGVLERSKDAGNGDIRTYAPQCCAFAVAVRDIFPKAEVGSAYIFPFPFMGMIELTPEMRKFVRMFDVLPSEQRTQLPEQSFDLEIPDEIIEQIDIQEIINSPTLEIVND